MNFLAQLSVSFIRIRAIPTCEKRALFVSYVANNVSDISVGLLERCNVMLISGMQHRACN
jgi:hypothetical protein